MGMSSSIGPGLMLAGTALSAGSALSRGSAAQFGGQSTQIEKNFEALQLNQDAGQAMAVAERNATDVGRQTTLINSSALARAAASGAGASDPSVMGVIARTAGEGAYRQGVALYEGESQARMDRLRAVTADLEGNMSAAQGNLAEKQSQTQAISTVLTGAANTGSMYRKYYPQSAPSNQTVGSGSFSGTI